MNRSQVLQLLLPSLVMLSAYAVFVGAPLERQAAAMARAGTAPLLPRWSALAADIDRLRLEIESLKSACEPGGPADDSPSNALAIINQSMATHGLLLTSQTLAQDSELGAMPKALAAPPWELWEIRCRGSFSALMQVLAELSRSPRPILALGLSIGIIPIDPIETSPAQAASAPSEREFRLLFGLGRS